MYKPAKLAEAVMKKNPFPTLRGRFACRVFDKYTPMILVATSWYIKEKVVVHVIYMIEKNQGEYIAHDVHSTLRDRSMELIEIDVKKEERMAMLHVKYHTAKGDRIGIVPFTIPDTVPI